MAMVKKREGQRSTVVCYRIKYKRPKVIRQMVRTPLVSKNLNL